MAFPARAPGRRSDPRCRARRLRTAERKDGRPERVSRTSRGRREAARRLEGYSDPEERNRRSVYIFVRRNARYPMLEAFDMPDTHESCGRRNQTITAPQAMSLLNGKVSLEWAQAFAGRVLKEAGADPNAQVERRLPAGVRPAAGRLREGYGADVLRQAEAVDCRARRGRRRSSRCPPRCPRATIQRKPRRWWISARCC